MIGVKNKKQVIEYLEENLKNADGLDIEFLNLNYQIAKNNQLTILEFALCMGNNCRPYMYYMILKDDVDHIVKADSYGDWWDDEEIIKKPFGFFLMEHNKKSVRYISRYLNYVKHKRKNETE